MAFSMRKMRSFNLPLRNLILFAMFAIRLCSSKFFAFLSLYTEYQANTFIRKKNWKETKRNEQVYLPMNSKNRKNEDKDIFRWKLLNYWIKWMHRHKGVDREFCKYLWYLVFAFNFHEWINEWAAIAFEIQCASLSIVYFPFPFLFTCGLSSQCVRILVSTKDEEQQQQQKIGRLFCLLFFIVSSLLASEMFAFFHLGKSRCEKRDAHNWKQVSGLQKIYECVDCATVAGYLSRKSETNETYYKWGKTRENKGKHHTIAMARAARNHLNDRFVAFWVNHTRVLFFCVIESIIEWPKENLDRFRAARDLWHITCIFNTLRICDSVVFFFSFSAFYLNFPKVWVRIVVDLSLCCCYELRRSCTRFTLYTLITIIMRSSKGLYTRDQIKNPFECYASRQLLKDI